MSMKSYPFDSEITGYEADGSPIYDRAADSAVLANWMKHYFSDGVFMEQASQTPGFQVLADSGMNVIVSAGACEIQGRFAYDENVTALTIPAADTTYDRIDTVALRLNLENDVRNIQLVVIPGTPASSPVAPALTRNLSVYDLGIANIRVAKNSANIAQSSITDTRLDTTRCGVVCVPMQVMDSKELYIQIQNDLENFRKEYEDSFESWSQTQRASFDAWFSNVQLTLDEEIAGNLYNLIAKDAFQTYAHTKTGKVHALDLSGGADVNIKFRASARFDAGDTFVLNGETVNALTPDGNALSDGYFVSGAICVGFYRKDNNTIYFVGGGSDPDKEHPVGSLFFCRYNDDAHHPANLFGGTWEAIEDVFLIGASETYPVTENAQDGGAAAVALTVSQMAVHSHGVLAYNSTAGASTTARVFSTGTTEPATTYKELTGTNTSAGGGEAHENMPPYKAYYIWERTA